ncbi:MAG: CD225/dispanin family protein [Muribaculaceae bacterium]|nr:CD225/dispanin family protein [Muribaculaceae bacterium]
MDKTYWIMSGDTRVGPLTYDELKDYPGLQPSTPVWHEGLADWTVASAIPELAFMWVVKPKPACASYARQEPEADGKPSSYLGWAIALMLICFIPTGVVAIIYASKVTPAWQRGDRAAAERASERAGWWCIITFVAGLIWAPFSVLYSIMTL